MINACRANLTDCLPAACTPRFRACFDVALRTQRRLAVNERCIVFDATGKRVRVCVRACVQMRMCADAGKFRIKLLYTKLLCRPVNECSHLVAALRAQQVLRPVVIGVVLDRHRAEEAVRNEKRNLGFELGTAVSCYLFGGVTTLHTEIERVRVGKT